MHHNNDHMCTIQHRIWQACTDIRPPEVNYGRPASSRSSWFTTHCKFRNSFRYFNRKCSMFILSLIWYLIFSIAWQYVGNIMLHPVVQTWTLILCVRNQCYCWKLNFPCACTLKKNDLADIWKGKIGSKFSRHRVNNCRTSINSSSCVEVFDHNSFN